MPCVYNYQGKWEEKYYFTDFDSKFYTGHLQLRNVFKKQFVQLHDTQPVMMLYVSNMYKNSQTANNVFYLTLFNQEAKTTGFGPYAIPSSGFHFIVDNKTLCIIQVKAFSFTKRVKNIHECIIKKYG
jgi:hypothetical protein